MYAAHVAREDVQAEVKPPKDPLKWLQTAGRREAARAAIRSHWPELREHMETIPNARVRAAGRALKAETKACMRDEE